MIGYLMLVTMAMMLIEQAVNYRIDQPVIKAYEQVGQQQSQSIGEQSRVYYQTANMILKGVYNIVFKNQNIPNLQIKITQNAFSFSACNHVELKYHILQNLKIRFGQSLSTQMPCQTDKDALYVETLKLARHIKFGNNKFALFDSSVRTIASAQLMPSPQTQSKIEYDVSESEHQTKQQQNSAYYNYKYSYKMFEDYFIVKKNDPIMDQIIQFVAQKFKSFISDSQLNINAAFRKYYDEYIQYLVVYKSDFSKNLGVRMFYNTEDLTLEFQELIPLKLSGNPTNTRNCAKSENFGCIQCYPGYQLYNKRCHLKQKQCVSYQPEECFKCIKNYMLVEGRCVEKI